MEMKMTMRIVAGVLVALLLAVAQWQTPALVDAGMTPLAVWLCAAGTSLFVFWLGVMWDRNHE